MTTHWALAGSLQPISGGNLYDQHIIEGLKQTGHSIRCHELEGCFIPPDAEAFTAAENLLMYIKSEPLVIDGLALPAFAPMLASQRFDSPIIALVHHRLVHETGLPEPIIQQLDVLEREALSHAEMILCTSPFTADDIQKNLKLTARPGIILPGVAFDTPRSRFRRRSKPLQMLSVGNIVPRKGYLELIEALSDLHQYPWKLRIIGDTSRDPAYFHRLCARIQRSRLNQRIHWIGIADKNVLRQAYRHADLFILPSRHEGYGMALAEATQCGLPIISTTAGAIPQTAPGGRLLPPGDIPALRVALESLMKDQKELARMQRRAAHYQGRAPTWEEAVSHFACAILNIGK